MRGGWKLALLALVLVVAWDASRPPSEQVTSRALLAGIDLYQDVLSGPLGTPCRFQPSCSRYAELSIRRHGVIVGVWRSAVRLARCGPWTPAGTVDLP